MQQVLVGPASLWGILLTVKISLEKQLRCCLLLRERFAAVPFRGVTYCSVTLETL